MPDDPSPDDQASGAPAGAARSDRDAFVELADEAAHEAAVQARAEARSRQARASELATWLGTLRDLAERRTDVVVRGSAGDHHRGRLVALALDHVALELPTGGTLLVPLRELRQLSSPPIRTLPPAAGDREPAQDRLLVDVLERCLEHRRPIVLRLRDVPDPLSGELVALGDDVLTIRAGGREATLYVPVEAIAEVMLPA